MDWRVLTALQTIKIGPKLWMLMEDMVFYTPEGMFIVPAGFITDHASVPRLFTAIVPPVQSEIAEASILHDWFYAKESEDVSRKFADLCLREITKARGGRSTMAYAAWSAVRMGGGSLYNKTYGSDKIKTMAYKEYRDCTPEMLQVIFKEGY